jgi:RNA recognition motif-containing protein
VSDETLAGAFSKGHPSFVKAKVVRDKFTTKSKGYGFVSYGDPEDFMKAWKEMNGQRRFLFSET